MIVFFQHEPAWDARMRSAAFGYLFPDLANLDPQNSRKPAAFKSHGNFFFGVLIWTILKKIPSVVELGMYLLYLDPAPRW